MIIISRFPLIHYILIVITLGILVISSPSLAQLRVNDNPGADQPDESALLGDDLYPTILENLSLNIDTDSGIAIIDNGFSRNAAMFFGLFLPVRMIDENDVPSGSSLIKLLVVPSGGLTAIKNAERARINLKNYVKTGGTLLVFSQRYGRDYSILPVTDDKPLAAFGWLEIQSALSKSSILSMRHPIASELTSSVLNFNVDGYIESFPDRSKPVLRSMVNGQPVMIVYKYGQGTVIVTTLYTDWAYTHQRVTWDEIRLFRGLLKWTGLPPAESSTVLHLGKIAKAAVPSPLPPLGFSVQTDDEVYLAGDIADFTIRLWNYENRARKIKVYYDEKGKVIELLPYGSASIAYSFPVFSARRLWVYFYDEDEIFLQTIRRGYSVVYP